MRRVQVFDVNETLLDLAALDPHFERAFGDAGVRKAWFSQVVQSALVATVTGAYRTFAEVGAAAPAMTAEQAGVERRAEDRDGCYVTKARCRGPTGRGQPMVVGR